MVVGNWIRIGGSYLKTILLIFLSVVLGAFGQLGMKWGVNHVHLAGKEGTFEILFKYMTSMWVLAGLAFYAVSALVWIMALGKVQLSYAYPMVSLGYIIVFILSYFLLGESITFLKVFGLLFICIGIVTISFSK